ncbi:MAG TPA: vitamin-B12 independent methionine synthase [Candidatus Binataceae bacterium]|nr:vitamin-B12 independent methionine synthase [Candidatus Binataceae bacterium]
MTDDHKSSLAAHPYAPDASFDGGDLDCGSGLLLLIRKHIDPLTPGQLLEIRSTEISVREDLPAWCRLTRNELVSEVHDGRQGSYLVSKGPFTLAAESARASDAGSTTQVSSIKSPAPITQPIKPVAIPATLPDPAPAAAIRPLAVMGIGSWPRPRWMLQALHEYLEGRLDEVAFQETANDAVRLAVEAQVRAGVDVISDGEQRRDNYASFVGGLLDNCQLVPITDLLPYVDHPDEFAEQLRALDVPASSVRHPAVFGPLGRSRALAVRELDFVRELSKLPVKIALPGPYLLTRTMWMECISDRAYARREDLAHDIVRVLREELHYLLAAGAALVQFDEPVLTEVVFGKPPGQRTFMCGALGSRLDTAAELAFAEDLINRVVEGLPRERLALHICRGNWSRDERVALAGDYRPLMPLLSRLKIGTLFLELFTPRAGEMTVLRELPAEIRLGVGAANQKSPRVESVDEIVAKAEPAIAMFGADRILLTPDCGFATFADNPLASSGIAEKKLAAIVEAARILRHRHQIN